MTDRPIAASPRAMWRNWLVYGLSSVASRLVGFLLLPIYTRVLTPEEYGVRAMIIVGVDLVGMLCSLGLTTAMVRFATGDRTEEGRPEAISTAYVTGAVVLAAGVALGMVVAPWLAIIVLGDAAYAGLLRLGLVSLFFVNTMEIGFAYLRFHRRAATVAILSLSTLAMTVTANLVFVVALRWGVPGILYGEILTYGIFSLLVAWLTLRQTGVTFSAALARRMVRYGAPLTLMPIAWLLVNRSDGVFLTHYDSLGATGVYALALQCAQVLLVAAVLPFRDVWDPAQFEVARDPNGARVYRRMFQAFTFTIVVAAFTFAIGAADVIRVMAAPRFHAAASVVPLLLIAHVVMGMSLFFNSGLLVRNRTALLGVIALVAALVNVAANALLVPRYLAAGAAMSRAIALLVMAALTYAIAQRLWPQRLDFVALGKVTSVAGALYILSGFIPDESSLIALVLKAGLVVALVIVSVAIGAVDRAELARLYASVRARLGARRPAMTPSLSTTILGDLRAKARWCYESERWPALVKTLATDGTPSMLLYRLMQWARRWRLTPLELLFNRLNSMCCNCIIGRGAEFGPGFVLIHAIGVVINGNVRGGSNVFLEHQVTIGAERRQAPVLGSDVFVGAGAKIIGAVRVGDGAKVGANAVVVGDVPAYATVVGIPARVVRRRPTAENGNGVVTLPSREELS